MAEEAGFDSSSAVKYFDPLVKQATRELQAMVPLTQKQFTSSFSEERLERLNRFAGERQAQLPVSSDEESKFFSHVLWKSWKKKRFSANLTEFSQEESLLAKLDREIHNLNAHYWIQGDCDKKIFTHLKTSKPSTLPVDKHTTSDTESTSDIDHDLVPGERL